MKINAIIKYKLFQSEYHLLDSWQKLEVPEKEFGVLFGGPDSLGGTFSQVTSRFEADLR